MLAVEKRKLNLISTLPGTTLVRPFRHGCWKSARWSAESIHCPVPFRGGEFGQGWGDFVDRIAAEVGIGDMALDALDLEGSGEGSATTVLDHVPQVSTEVGSPMTQKSRGFAPRHEGLHDGDGPVHRIAFLVGGEQRRSSRGGPGARRRSASTAVTEAATEDFMSAAPRP